MGGSLRHVERQRFAGGIAAVVRRRPTGCRHRHRAAGCSSKSPPSSSHRRATARRGTRGRACRAGNRRRTPVVRGRRWRRQRDLRGGGVVWTGRGAACGFVAHRWSFPRPVPGNPRRGSAPHDRRARPTPWHGRIPLMSVREGPATGGWSGSIAGGRATVRSATRRPSEPATDGASAACASGTRAASSTPAMIGVMINPSTSSRSNDPPPPQLRVSDSRPSSWSTTWAMSPAISDARS